MHTVLHRVQCKVCKVCRQANATAYCRNMNHRRRSLVIHTGFRRRYPFQLTTIQAHNAGECKGIEWGTRGNVWTGCKVWKISRISGATVGVGRRGKVSRFLANKPTDGGAAALYMEESCGQDTVRWYASHANFIWKFCHPFQFCFLFF